MQGRKNSKINKALKRLASNFLFAIFVCTLIFTFGCNSYTNNIEVKSGEFSVHYLDVGQGDSIFINFPDGKNMLIDTGLKDSATAEFICDVVKLSSLSKIDYFVLTHPDADHIGNAKSIIENFSIGKMFVPKIVNTQNFPLFDEIMTYSKSKNIETVISDFYKYESGENWFFAFLSPKPYLSVDSIYNDVNADDNPQAEDINNLSPIIYLEYMGIRFLFTGDAGESQENLVVNLSKVSAYKTYFNQRQINLDKIDFLKMGHHGSDESSSEKFLEYITPQNAIISVGENNYNLPSKYSLMRLVTVNPNVLVYRTDTNGSISVYVNNVGEYEIKTCK